MPRRRLAAVLAVAGVLLSSCALQTDGSGMRLGTSVPGNPVPEALRFRDCTSSLVANGLPIPPALKAKITIGCGVLSVPLDYAHPHGTTIHLTVVRIHDSDNRARPAQSLLINPGGPGASGLNFALGFLGELPTAVLAGYDVIGFDPRGVQLSSPINCLTDSAKDKVLATAPDLTTAAGFVQAERAATSFADSCRHNMGSALPFYNTVNTAKDMDQIRQSVGSDRMNYLGFSYGTELGWVYAHLFPDRVRAFVLDGAVDPDADPNAPDGAQLAGFEQAFDQFAANCKTVAPCNQIADARASVARIGAAARAHPLRTGTSRPLTYGLAITGVLRALYSKTLWARLATGLIAAEHGDGAPLLRLADDYNERAANGTYSNILDANTTIGCNDSEPGPSTAVIRTAARAWAAHYPIFGRWAGSSLLTCQRWQRHRTPVPDPKAATPTKVLVVGNLHDPATPYKGATDLARDLGNAELLTWNGEGHTSYLSGSSCVDNSINGYLLSLKLPPANTVCPAK